MTETIKNFWDKSHDLSAIADEKFKALVPGVGQCETLQGELLRASSKIGYDWYNNGWGCNNWSGAVVFIQKKFRELPVQPSDDRVKELAKQLRFVSNFSHGEPFYATDADADKAVTAIHEIIVQALIDNPEPVANTIDMHEFREPDYINRGDEDDEFF